MAEYLRHRRRRACRAWAGQRSPAGSLRRLVGEEQRERRRYLSVDALVLARSGAAVVARAVRAKAAARAVEAEVRDAPLVPQPAVAEAAVEVSRQPEWEAEPLGQLR